MSEGLKNEKEEEIEEEGDAADDPDRISVNPPVRRDAKKTKTQRNKEKRKKLQVDMELITDCSTFRNEIFLFCIDSLC